MNIDIRKETEQIRNYVVNLRKHFHQNPELSMEEWEARLKENVPQPSALSNLLQGMNQAAGKVCQGVSDTAGIFLMNKD